MSAECCGSSWSIRGGTIPVLRVGSASCCRVHLGCELERPRGHDPRLARWQRAVLPSTPRTQDGVSSRSRTLLRAGWSRLASQRPTRGFEGTPNRSENCPLHKIPTELGCLGHDLGKYPPFGGRKWAISAVFAPKWASGGRRTRHGTHLGPRGAAPPAAACRGNTRPQRVVGSGGSLARVCAY